MAANTTPEELSWTVFGLLWAGAIAFFIAVAILVLNSPPS